MSTINHNSSEKISQQISRVASLYESGQFTEANELCSDILRFDPHHCEALHAAGVTSLQLGRPHDACESLKQAVRANPNSAVYQSNLGAAYRVLGQHDTAAECFERALELQPEFAGAHFNLGLCLESLCREEEAVSCYRHAIAEEPTFEDAYVSLAKLLIQLGRVDAAVETLRSGMEQIPNRAPLYFHLANAQRITGDLRSAYDAYLTARQLAPHVPEIHNNMGSLLDTLDRLPEAAFCFEQAIRCDSNFADAYNNLGVVYQKQRKYADARTCFEQAIAICPQLDRALCNLGNLAKECGNEAEAVAKYEQVLKVDPDNADALNNLGDVLEEQGAFAEAVACFEQAPSDCDESIEARFHLAQNRLREGDFERGWDGYELRWRRKEAEPREVILPRWDGSPLNSRSLVILREQGVGDEVLFSSCVPDFAIQNEQIFLECDPRLEPVFKRSFPKVTVVTKPVGNGVLKPSHPDDIRLQTAIGTLPRSLRRAIEDFPRRRTFLLPNPELCQQWQRRLRSLGRKLKVGISWRGGVKEEIRKKKSTTLDQWTPLLAIPDIAFINLQYGNVAAELADCSKETGITIHDFAQCAPLHSLEEFAALVASLDLVISVSNTTVHFSGALGVPTWSLLSFVADWRWMLDRSDSPWYDSIRLFRQPERGAWAPLFDKVAAELSQFASER